MIPSIIDDRAVFWVQWQFSSTQNGLTCPTCKKVYGIKTGDMPQGTMSVRHTSGSLPGHEGAGTIEIIYHFSPGVHVCVVDKQQIF